MWFCDVLIKFIYFIYSYLLKLFASRENYDYYNKQKISKVKHFRKFHFVYAIFIYFQID